MQHSAGSGKSNTIAWPAHRLSNLHDDTDHKVFDKVMVITDRVVLDRQLQDSIYQFKHAALPATQHPRTAADDAPRSGVVRRRRELGRQPGEPIEWVRPQVGEHHRARIEAGGLVVADSGESYASLSMAADNLTGGSHNGWDMWKVPWLGGIRIAEVRQQFLFERASQSRY